MKIDPKLQDYTNRTGHALMSKPPRTWPVYEADPVAAWRYVCRLYGHGLAGFDEAQVKDVCSTLYGSWFVRCELSGRKLPAIDNKDFIKWILDARRECLPHAQQGGEE